MSRRVDALAQHRPSSASSAEFCTSQSAIIVCVFGNKLVVEDTAKSAGFTPLCERGKVRANKGLMTRQKTTSIAKPLGTGPGRPLSFDPDRVLDAALSLFWRNGYAATSLDMIVEATGVARPSLARQFGDKTAIYVACLERFRERLRATVGATLRERAPVDVTLLAFCDAAISMFMTGGANPLGCLIINTAPSATNDAPEIQAVLREALAEMDGAVQKSLKAAQQRGQLPSDADVQGLALLVSSLVQSLAIRARAGAQRRELKSAARRAIAQLMTGLA